MRLIDRADSQLQRNSRLSESFKCFAKLLEQSVSDYQHIITNDFNR